VSDRVASLPMYDLAEVQPAAAALWSEVSGRLRDAGVNDVPSSLRWGGNLYADNWLHPQLMLSQACGWPVVDRLAGLVAVVGAFTYGVSDATAHYRSLLVTRSDDAERPLAGRRAAVNSYDSLSGWISLQAAVQPLGPIVTTGAHLESVRAVATGRADLACIDAVTWALLARYRPSVVSPLAVVGRGPVIPCVPLITSPTLDPGVDRLRTALTGLSSDGLGITGFVPLDESDYVTVRDLVPTTVPR
jgi:ABC-type phosphate/phosphonate transport system substrate-binding protein